MRKLVCYFSAAVILVSGIGLAVAKDGEGKSSPKKAEPKVVTLEGEILDLSCYLDHNAHGKKHRNCAINCIKGGATMGFLTKDGKLYTILNDPHDKKQVVDADDAGEQISLKAVILEKQGQSYLHVKEIVGEYYKEEEHHSHEEEGSGMKEEGSSGK